MARITVLINDRPGRIYRINKKISIGRDAANEIQILDQKVSRRHVTVEKRKGFFILKDLGSRNGTFINDVRVDESELKTGDRIRIGNTSLSFGEDPIVDGVDDTETGDLPIPDPLGKGLKIYQYDQHKLKDLANLSSDRQAMKVTTRRLAEIVAFAGHIRSGETSSLVFQSIQDILHEMFPIDRSYILLKNPQTQNLQNVAVRSTLQTSHQPDFENPLFQRVLADGVSLFSRKGFGKQDDDMSGAFRGSIRMAVCVPLKSNSRILGMVYGDLSSGAEPLTNVDLMMISALGAIAGSQIDVWQHQKKLSDRLISCLQIGSEIAESAIGSNNNGKRSRRMAESARMIADYMGLPEDQLEVITAAAFVTSMLSISASPVSITETLPEDRQGDSSVEDTYILKMEMLPGMTEIARIVKLRTENFDGTGTPDGLSGNAIPLGSRILRSVLMLEELDRSDAEMIETTLKHFSGSVLDPLIVRAIKQCATRLMDRYRPKQ